MQQAGRTPLAKRYPVSCPQGGRIHCVAFDGRSNFSGVAARAFGGTEQSKKRAAAAASRTSRIRLCIKFGSCAISCVGNSQDVSGRRDAVRLRRGLCSSEDFAGENTRQLGDFYAAVISGRAERGSSTKNRVGLFDRGDRPPVTGFEL